MNYQNVRIALDLCAPSWLSIAFGLGATGEDAMQTIQRRADSEFSSHDQELGPAASHDPPLDLVHLSQQCQGDVLVQYI
jgi:hypothetical protein